MLSPNPDNHNLYCTVRCYTARCAGLDSKVRTLMECACQSAMQCVAVRVKHILYSKNPSGSSCYWKKKKKHPAAVVQGSLSGAWGVLGETCCAMCHLGWTCRLVWHLFQELQKIQNIREVMTSWSASPCPSYLQDLHTGVCHFQFRVPIPVCFFFFFTSFFA